MQGIPLNKNALFAVLGTNLGGKLLASLNDCCKLNVSLAFTAPCAGVKLNGGTYYFMLTDNRGNFDAPLTVTALTVQQIQRI